MMNARGITFPFTYTGETLGVISGGRPPGAVYDGLLELGVQIDFEKLAGWKGTSFLVNALYPHGDSITDLYVHDFNRLSNIDAYHDERLNELWLQQCFSGDKFSLRVGQLRSDAEFFISNNAALFLNSAFGVIPVVSQNFNSPIYPTAAPGFRFRFAPNDAFYALFGVFTADAGNQATNNRNGTRFFNGNRGALLLWEIAYTTNPPSSTDGDGKQQMPVERPLSGTFKVGGFYNTDIFKDLTGGSQQRGDYAFYLIADQEVWHKSSTSDEGLKLFGRIGAAPADRNVVSFYCDGGLNYKGIFPTRNNDIFGIGVSYTKISHYFSDPSGSPVPTHYEGIIELTYQAPINANFTLQPDLQYIFNPGAVGRSPNALVAGLRFNINF